MMNNSGIKPLGRAVLVKHIERKEGLIIIPETVAERTLMVETEVEVIEIGPECWRDESPRAKPGDKVLIAKMSGYMVGKSKDGERYRLVNDRDIFAQVME